MRLWGRIIRIVHEEFSFAVSISCPKYPVFGREPLPQIPTTSVRVRNFKRTGGTFEALRFHIICFALCRLHIPRPSDLLRDLRSKLISDF